jgi:predicted ArsR family transcriptional regulator
VGLLTSETYVAAARLLELAAQALAELEDDLDYEGLDVTAAERARAFVKEAENALARCHTPGLR